MGTQVLDRDVITRYPNNSDRSQFEDIVNLLTENDSTYAEINIPGKDSIILPKELAELLVEAARRLRQGKAVFLSSSETQLTTQQAADLLGISRPTFVKLLEENEIPFVKVGRHRRVYLKDVETYSAKQHNNFMLAMSDLSANTNPLDTVDNPLIRG